MPYHRLVTWSRIWNFLTLSTPKCSTLLRLKTPTTPHPVENSIFIGVIIFVGVVFIAADILLSVSLPLSIVSASRSETQTNILRDFLTLEGSQCTGKSLGLFSGDPASGYCRFEYTNWPLLLAFSVSEAIEQAERDFSKANDKKKQTLTTWSIGSIVAMVNSTFLCHCVQLERKPLRRNAEKNYKQPLKCEPHLPPRRLATQLNSPALERLPRDVNNRRFWRVERAYWRKVWTGVKCNFSSAHFQKAIRHCKALV